MPPTPQGKGDPSHFFINIRNYVNINNIKSEKDKSNILMSCLSEDALDLYISFEKHEQTDIVPLEKIFMTHFKPTKHDLVEIEF